MKFKSAHDVLDTIRAGDNTEFIRAENRVRINNAANGFPPLTDQEAEKAGMKVNFNSMEFAQFLAQAKRQYIRAMQGGQYFFRVSIPDAPPDKQTDWELFITRKINRYLKKSKDFFFLQLNKWQSVVSHGIGPQMWWDKEELLPKFVAIEDLRVATDTRISFDNLEWFAVRVAYCEGDLSERVFGENADPHWNKSAIGKILEHYHDRNWNDAGWNYNWVDAPEKMAELVKQNIGWYSSDAVPTIPLWHFYHRDRKNHSRGRCWKMCVVPDWNVEGETQPDEFLYDNPDPVADELDHLLHVQFGDLANKTPQLYHSVRSLGYLLMEPCFWSNIIRCRSAQHLMEAMNILLRSTDPAGRARAAKVELYDKGFIPEGVTIVPNTERHQVDPQWVQMVMSQMRQLMSETAASYTQEADSGTQKEQTAYETHVKVSMVNAMMEALLLIAFFQETSSYEEMCRRFCLRETSNDIAKKFQEECERFGIPRVFVNVEMWDIESVMPMGAGNPALAISEAQQLLQMRPMFGPVGQQEILHEATAVLTGDPRKAARWAPIDSATKITPAKRQAQNDFATLMLGLPVAPPESNYPDTIDTLLGLLAGKVSITEQNGNMATMDSVIGMRTVLNHVQGLVGFVAQDVNNKPRVKVWEDALGNLDNAIKGFEQRLQEQMGEAQQQQPDPAQIAKAQTIIASSELKDKIKAQSSAQKAAERQQTHAQKIAQDQERHALEMQKMQDEAVVNTTIKDIETSAKLRREAKEPATNAS